MIQQGTNPWSREQIVALIDAHKEERCLYASGDPNYHNKNLRRLAEQRIVDAVSIIRPGSTAKQCLAKIKNLRNQFNVENAKVKNSLRSGTGTNSVYTPSLWYFEQMKYLADFVLPRASKSSKVPAPASQSLLAEEHVETESDGFDDNGRLDVYVLSQDDSTQDLDLDDSQISVPLSPAESFRTIQSPPPIIQTAPTSTSSSRTSTPTPAQPTMRRGNAESKAQTQYQKTLETIASILSILSKPDQAPVRPRSPPPRPLTPVSTCMEFLGSVLHTFVHEDLKMEVLDSLVQTVMKEKLKDCRRQTSQ